MDLGLTGRKAIVTGGTTGIGFTIADTLCREGADVSICARSEGPLEAAVEALRKHGTKVTGVALDVTDLDAFHGWIDATAAEFGGLDIAVNNVTAAAKQGDDGWHTSLDVDVLSFVHTVEFCLPHLRESDAGSLVGIGSIAATQHPAAHAHSYGAMKAAMIHQAMTLSQQLLPQGVRVNVVSPGVIFDPDGFWGTVQQERPEFFAEVIAKIPRGRAGSLQELANVVAFAASPAAALVSGVNLVADGGASPFIHF